MAINVKDKLVTLESLGVAYSAEQDAREEADQALSTRIDNIVAPEGDPSLTEVSDARVSGSTTYNTLKARLDADKAAVETEISQLSADLSNSFDGLNRFCYTISDEIKNILLQENIPYKIESSFSQGGCRNISVDDVLNASANTISSSKIYNKGMLYITVPSGYKALVAYYNEDKTYYGYRPTSGYVSGAFSAYVSSAPYIRIEVRKIDDSDFNAGDFDASLFDISFEVTTNPIPQISNNVKELKEISQEIKLKKADCRNLDILGLRKNLGGEFQKVDLPILDFLTDIDIPLYTDGYTYKHYVDLRKSKNISNTIIEVHTSAELENALTVATDGDTIQLSDGCYSPILINKSINIIGNNVFIMPFSSDFVETATNNVYKSTTAVNNPIGVYDISKIEDGIILPLLRTDSTGLTSPGTFYVNSQNLLYIHLYDDIRVTPKNVFVDLSIVPLTIDGDSESLTVYLEGVTVLGGASNLKAINSASFPVQKVFAYNCKFFKANLNNAVTLLGVNGYFQNCEAAFAYRDGFNYHKNNDVVSNCLEIDCTGHDNGKNADAITETSNNGTTIHDGASGLRIGGIYYNNYGGNVADISVGTITYNYDCMAFDSLAIDDTNGDFWCNFGGKMYLYGCRAPEGISEYNLRCASGNIYYANTEFGNKIGNVSELT